MKKKVLFSILSCLLVIVILYGLYLVAFTKYRENSVLDYLIAQGYSQTEIKDIEAHHSFINVILSYPEWQVHVIFEDEPGVDYFYGFNSSGEISQSGVSGGSADLEKEGLKHSEPPQLRITDSKNEWKLYI